MIDLILVFIYLGAAGFFIDFALMVNIPNTSRADVVLIALGSLPCFALAGKHVLRLFKKGKPPVEFDFDFSRDGIKKNTLPFIALIACGWFVYRMLGRILA